MDVCVCVRGVCGCVGEGDVCVGECVVYWCWEGVVMSDGDVVDLLID